MKIFEEGVTPGEVVVTFPPKVEALTVTVAVIELPIQPFAVGVIVNVTT